MKNALEPRYVAYRVVTIEHMFDGSHILRQLFEPDVPAVHVPAGVTHFWHHGARLQEFNLDMEAVSSMRWTLPEYRPGGQRLCLRGQEVCRRVAAVPPPAGSAVAKQRKRKRSHVAETEAEADQGYVSITG